MNAPCIPGIARLRPAVGGTAAVACCLALFGCAAGQPWRPFQDQEKAARERAKYGPTADERIKALAADGQRARSGSPRAQQEFAQSLVAAMLQEHDPRVRCEIVKIAADCDADAARAICAGALEDPDERVRMAACSAWSKRGGPEAVRLLGARYQADAELDVRLRALRELGTLGDKEAVPVLARALEDPDPAVQYRAVAALKKVSGRDLGNDVNAWREWAADPQGTAAEWSMAEAFRRLW